jgi:1-acyl-sn-glycerol-3-phosphate acyltransferase
MRKFWIGYWFKNWYFPYKIGYAITITGSRTYFKKLKYQGKEKIPKNAGIIYAVNHQNAFLDPIVIAGRTRQPTNFLTRADIFKKPFVAKILSQLYMLPIYRQRDGANAVKMNEKNI